LSQHGLGMISQWIERVDGGSEVWAVPLVRRKNLFNVSRRHPMLLVSNDVNGRRL